MPSLLFRRLTIETLSVGAGCPRPGLGEASLAPTVHMFNHRINKFFGLL